MANIASVGGGSSRSRVWLGEVNGYSQEALDSTLEEGIRALGGPPQGRLFMVADWTLQLPGLCDAAATRPEFVVSAVEALLEPSPDSVALLTGSSYAGVSARRVAGFRVRGRRSLRSRGLYALQRRFRRRLALRPVDECRYSRFQLSVGRRMARDELVAPPEGLDPWARYWDRVVLPNELFIADHVVLFPKLKARPGSGFSGAVTLQAYGLLRKEDRNGPFGRHAARAEADLLEVCSPSLVVSDGIEIGYGGSCLTQSARKLGVVVIADNALAHDWVCAELLRVSPRVLESQRIAAERGYGPASIDEVEVVGPGRRELFSDRVLGFGSPLPSAPVEVASAYEEVTGAPFPISVLPSESPSGDSLTMASRAVLEWMARVLDHPDTSEKAKWWPSTTLVVGALDHRPHAQRVILVGDRAAQTFLAHAKDAQAWFKVPELLQRLIFGFSVAYRYGLRGGGRGWALRLDGDPPRVRDLDRALFWSSRLRIRSPLLFKARLWLEGTLFRLWPAVLRAARNRLGIPVVHARKMSRTEKSTWRQSWLKPAALELRALEPQALRLHSSEEESGE